MNQQPTVNMRQRSKANDMVLFLSYILGLLPLVVLIGRNDGVETISLSRKPESLATSRTDPLLNRRDKNKVRVVAPAPSSHAAATKSDVVVVETTRLLATARPTRRPTTRRPTTRRPSSAPSLEPTSFTIPPTSNLSPVVPTRPTKSPVTPPAPSVPARPLSPVRPIVPTKLPVAVPVIIAPSPVAPPPPPPPRPTSPSGPLQRFIQFIKRILGLDNSPPPTPAGGITGLQLVKAVSGELVTSLSNTTVVYLNGTTPNFTIVAITMGGPISSVQFTWNSSTLYRTEKISPYTLCGGKSYNPCTNLQAGAHTVTATVNGQVGTLYRVAFTIVNGTKQPNPTRVPTRRPTRTPTKSPTRPPTRPPTKRPTRRPTAPTAFPTPSQNQPPTATLPPRLSCPRDAACPNENLMQKFCVTQCVAEANFKRKRRAGWRCGRCPLQKL
jgi:hypothetical protein